VFVAGYSFCRYVHSDQRYTILRKNDIPYLYDRQLERSLPIDEQQFQVGTLEYRLEGVLKDRHLSKLMERLERE
jgi:hypothetical protein